MRSRPLLGSGLLVVALATGCGDPPEDASVEEFCRAYGSLFQIIVATGADPSDDEIVDASHEWADNLAEVGTPPDMSEQARSGFELLIENLNELDPDMAPKNPDELLNANPDFDFSQLADTRALTDYVVATCPIDEELLKGLE